MHRSLITTFRLIVVAVAVSLWLVHRCYHFAIVPVIAAIVVSCRFQLTVAVDVAMVRVMIASLWSSWWSPHRDSCSIVAIVTSQFLWTGKRPTLRWSPCNCNTAESGSSWSGLSRRDIVVGSPRGSPILVCHQHTLQSDKQTVNQSSSRRTQC